MAIAEGVAALKSLKSLYDIAKEVRDSNDPERLKVAAAQMFDLALAAREQTAMLQEERNAAVAELAAIKADQEKAVEFAAQANAFERIQVGAGFVYVEKDEPKGARPYFCLHCFGSKKISMLQPAGGAGVFAPVVNHLCPECKNGLPIYMENPGR